MYPLSLTALLSEGWGAKNHCDPKPSDQLQETKQKIMKYEDCKATKGDYREYNSTEKKCFKRTGSYENLIDPHMVCAESQRTSTCFGDTGSPFTVIKENKGDKYHFLMGVYSWQFGCAEVIVKNPLNFNSA